MDNPSDQEVEAAAEAIYRVMGFDPLGKAVLGNGQPYGNWLMAIKAARAALIAAAAVRARTEVSVRDLTPLEPDQDDGTVNVRWADGDRTISLVCFPTGKLIRASSPWRESEPPVTTHVLALSASGGNHEVQMLRTSNTVLSARLREAVGVIRNVDSRISNDNGDVTWSPLTIRDAVRAFLAKLKDQSNA